MSQESQNRATEVFRAHPELREVLRISPSFAELKGTLPGPFEIDGESIFMLRGDAGQVTEDELFVEALRSAVLGTGQSQFERIARALLSELDARLQDSVRRRFSR
jgi:hypothetical protein